MYRHTVIPSLRKQKGVQMNSVIAIDPGAEGGLAWVGADGVAAAEKMPAGMTAVVDRLRELSIELRGCEAVVEKVGQWVPGDHPNAATKFARHCGNVEAALYAAGIAFREVAPGVWMRSLGKLPSEKAARKRAIRELMARRYPHLCVTLKTADALGILSWELDMRRRPASSGSAELCRGDSATAESEVRS